jgi:DNA-binding NtrC family response regulator
MPAVLVAESDPGLRNLFRLLLRSTYVVIEAPSAMSAMETLRTSPEPLVVLWDLWLSNAEGPHLLDAIELEPAIGRHALLLLSPDVEAVAPARRKQAQRLHIPLIRMPFDVGRLLEEIGRQHSAATIRKWASN